MTVETRPQTFRAMRTFVLAHRGGASTTVQCGEELRFDGTTVILHGRAIVYPNLIGAIKCGWITPTTLKKSCWDWLREPAL